MRIKRFEAPDTKTALAMVKEQMGVDAVILASRTIAPVQDGVAKKGRESWVEVVAAMDYDLEDLTWGNGDILTDRTGTRRSGPESGKSRENQILPQRGQGHPDPTPLPNQVAAQSKMQISIEAQELRKRFAGTQKDRASANQKKSLAPPLPIGQHSRHRAEEIARWRDNLLGQLRINSPQQLPGADGPLVLALVGGTGVGKTTTAAKLAAWYTLRRGCKVALLSMDCYRIGATDQLRTYARIMRLNCEIALRKRDLQQALDRHRRKDLIIIDTAGKSPFDEKHIAELREWFAVDGAIKPYLVISATTKKEDLTKVLETYAPLAPESLVITKLDETRSYATVCQQVVAAGLPVSYICTGQRVPEDFLVASKDFLEKLFKYGWQAVAPELQAAAAPEKWQERATVHQG